MTNIVTNLVKKNNYVQIFIDEIYFCSVTEDTLVNHRIFTGKEIDALLRDILLQQSNVDKLYNKLLRIISVKLYSKSELTKKLREYANKFSIDYDESIIENLITKISYLGLFDENQNLKTICKIYQDRNKGKNYISQKLFERGFAKQDIKDLIMNIQDSESAIIALLQKKYQLIKSKETDKKKLYEKLVRFGFSRGFSYDDLKEPIRRILQHT